MDAISAYHAATDQIVVLVGGDDKLAHVHAGLAIYLVAQVAFRTRRASLNAVFAVVILEAVNEALDRLFWGFWQWPDTGTDIVATLFWPSALYLVGRYRRQRWHKRERRRLATLLVPATRRSLA